MAHRIREAMADYDGDPLGGKGKVVEADELFIGKPDEIFVNGVGWQKKRGYATKRKVISLVERGGRARSFHVKDIDAATVRKVLFENIILDSRLHTDEAQHYKARQGVRQARSREPQREGISPAFDRAHPLLHEPRRHPQSRIITTQFNKSPTTRSGSSRICRNR